MLSLYRLKTEEWPFTKDDVGDLITWCILGVLLGGRLGYVLFYGKGMFWAEPWKIIVPFSRVAGHWQFTGISGMSYHGGVIGVMIAVYLYARKKSTTFFTLGDFLTPAIPLGFTFGRIGNFINGELYGRLTNHAIGMYFPEAGDFHLRHPSQLYEAFFEGLVLFAISWPLRKKSKSMPGFSSGLYIFGYGFFRFFIEFFRQPDAHMGFVLGPFSMGQVLCFGMLIVGSLLWWAGWKSKKAALDD